VVLLAAGLMSWLGPLAAQAPPGRLPGYEAIAAPLAPPPLEPDRPGNLIAVPPPLLLGPAAWPALIPDSAVRPAEYRPDPVPPPLPPGPLPPPPAPGPMVAAVNNIAPAVGVVSVETIGPPTVAPGQPLTFEIVVRNTGAAALSQIRVEDALPPGARFLFAEPAPEVHEGKLTWQLGGLETGAERRLKVHIQPGSGPEVVLHPSVTATTVGLRTRIVRPMFEVGVAGPTEVRRGSTAAFRVRLANHGTESLQKILARVKLPAGLRHPGGAELETDLGDLRPGEERALPPVEVTAVQTGYFSVEASARTESGAEGAGQAVVAVAEPTLGLRIIGARESFTDRDLDLRLEALNPGDTAVTGARVSLMLPEGLELLSANGGAMRDPATGALTWSLAALPVGGGATLTAQLRPRRTGEWTLTAVAAANGLVEARAVLPLRVTAAAALWLEPGVHDEHVAVGAETTCELRLVNRGALPASGIRLTAWLPEGLRAVSAEGPTQARVADRQVVFEPLAQLGPQATGVYRLRIAGQRIGTWQLRAEVAPDAPARSLGEVLAVTVTGAAPGDH
jgi:uncharacterized repeat protein (TIGR01451 family)